MSNVKFVGVIAVLSCLFGGISAQVNCTDVDANSEWNNSTRLCECNEGLTWLPTGVNDTLQCGLMPIIKTLYQDETHMLRIQAGKVLIRVWNTNQGGPMDIEVVKMLLDLQATLLRVDAETMTQTQIQSFVDSVVQTLPTSDQVSKLEFDVEALQNDLSDLSDVVDEKADANNVYTIGQIDTMLTATATTAKNQADAVQSNLDDLDATLQSDYYTKTNVDDKFDALELDPWTEKNTQDCVEADLGLTRYHTKYNEFQTCRKHASIDEFYWWPIGSPEGCIKSSVNDRACDQCIYGLKPSQGGWRCEYEVDFLHLTMNNGVHQKQTVQTGYMFMEGFYGRDLAYTFKSAPRGQTSIHFDGGDYLHVEELPVLTGAFTACVFVKYYQFNAWSRVYGFANGERSDNLLLANQGTTRNIIYETYQGSSARNIVINDGWWPGENYWVHVCGRTQANGVMALFRNGHMLGQKAGWVPRPVSRQEFRVGRSHWPDALFRGEMADLRVYSSALPDDEIKRVACGEESLNMDSTSCNDLIAWYRFEGNTEDSSISGWHGSYQGTAIGDMYVTDCPEGNHCVRLAGGNQHVTLPSRVVGGPLSFCAWVRYWNFGKIYSRVLGAFSGTPNNNIYISNLATSSGIRFGTFIGTSGSHMDAPYFFEHSYQRFMHMCATVGSDGLVVYRNGREFAKKTSDVRIPPYVARSMFTFGRSAWGGDGYLHADLDDYRIYAHQLSPEEVAGVRCVNETHNLNCVGLMARFTFDGHVRDVSRNMVRTQLYNPTVRHPFKTENAPQGSGYIELDAASYLDVHVPRIGGPLSVCSWVRYDKGNAWSRVFDFANQRNTGSNNILMAYQPPGHLFFSIRRDGNNEKSITINNILSQNLGKFIHVCATSQGSVFSLYVNGVLRNRGAGHEAQYADRYTSYIGRGIWDGDGAFEGALDDLRVYDYALSDAEVKALYELPN